MAEEIAFNITTDIGGAKSLKELKQDFKDAQKELGGLTIGTKEYVKALEKLGGIRDHIGDLNAEINAFNPEGKVKAFGNVIGGVASGFQAATGAAALFGGQSKELEKTLLKVQAATAFAEGIKGIMGMKDAFTILGNVLKANPIMLIATIVIAIGVALFELKDKIKPVADAFDFLGKIVGGVVQGIKNMLDFIGLTNFAMDGLSNSIVKNTERIKNATNDRYDSEIAAAKRAGKETETLEIAKLAAATKTNDVIISQLRHRQAAGEELNDEDKKKLDELVSANKKAYQDILNLSDTYKDREVVNQQKITDKWIAENEKRKQAVLDQQRYADKINAEADAYDAERKAKKKADQDAAYAEWSANLSQQGSDWQAGQTANRDATIAANEASAQNQRDTTNGSLELAKTSNDGMIALSNLYFDAKRSSLQKGSKEELKAAKKQFEINKSLSVVSATIMGIQATIAAYQSGAAVPVVGVVLGPAMAALAAITAASNIAKIENSTFDGGAAKPSAGGGGGGSGAIAPTISAPQNGSTKIDANGNVLTPPTQRSPIIKAQVVETEMTGTQRRVGSIETNAKI